MTRLDPFGDIRATYERFRRQSDWIACRPELVKSSDRGDLRASADVMAPVLGDAKALKLATGLFSKLGASNAHLAASLAQSLSALAAAPRAAAITEVLDPMLLPEARVFARDDSPFRLPLDELAFLVVNLLRPSRSWGVMGYGYGRPFFEGDRQTSQAGIATPDSYSEMLRRMNVSVVDDLKPGQAVLDVGSGYSNSVEQMMRYLGVEARAVDLIFHERFGIGAEPDGLAAAEVRKTAREIHGGLDLSRRIGASVTNLPVADASFDRVIAIISMRYLFQAGPVAFQLGVAELLRVMKPGGKAWIHDDPTDYAKLLPTWGVPFKVTGGVVIERPEMFEPTLVELSA
jgi:hypothetical protein